MLIVSLLFCSTHSSLTIEEEDIDTATLDPLTSSSASSCKLDRIHSWVRDIDNSSANSNNNSNNVAARDLIDDDEFNATLTACEANSEVLIAHGRGSQSSLIPLSSSSSS